ncbi:hypothetical protein [Vibrio phage phiKT1024]|nr:hypothetical protein [Vibrio phage phiKT1024]
MTIRHKKLNKIQSEIEARNFFNKLDNKELKAYAGILKTPLGTTRFIINDVSASNEDIINDLIEQMFG